MNNFIIFSSVFLAFLVAAWVAYPRRRRGGGGGELPPGPSPLPIFGNIFQLGKNPHTSLAQLAKTYGPLMSLKLGTQLAVVVSSPETAMEMLKNQSHIFINRSKMAAFSVHGHGEISMVIAPGNSDQWKKLRRLSKEKLLSPRALQLSQDLRQETLRKLADHVSSCCGTAMDVGEAAFTTMSNLMFATLFSSSDSGDNKKLKEHVNSIAVYIGVPNISDVFPVLAPLDPQGLQRKISHHMGCILEIIESMIEQRLKQREASSSTGYQKKNDFLETLLDLMEGDEYDLSIEEIKHLLLDLFLGGSDTSAATTEWAMVELLLHPHKLAKVKAELKSVVGDDRRTIEESDISRLPYLQATIKETLRYHPPAPLLVPLETVEETRVNGYKIPKNTKVMLNFWATTRDPSIWNDPESFEPENFLSNNIDFKGQHFELIPFGSGRRICPGIPLASRMVHCMVATLCLNFDWKLEGGRRDKSKPLEREEVFGLAMHKKNPLRAIPIKV